MPWVLLRETADLVDDPERRGRPAADIPVDERLGVGTRTGAALASGTIELVVWWLNANGQPVFSPADDDTLVVEPVHIVDTEIPGGERLLVGEASTFVTAAYRPLQVDLSPRGSLSLRLTGMTAPGAGADRAAVYYWSNEPQ